MNNNTKPSDTQATLPAQLSNPTHSTDPSHRNLPVPESTDSSTGASSHLSSSSTVNPPAGSRYPGNMNPRLQPEAKTSSNSVPSTPTPPPSALPNTPQLPPREPIDPLFDVDEIVLPPSVYVFFNDVRIQPRLFLLPPPHHPYWRIHLNFRDWNPWFLRSTVTYSSCPLLQTYYITAISSLWLIRLIKFRSVPSICIKICEYWFPIV